MLSVANPPGPPCSSNLLDQGSDERDHPPERPSSPEVDLAADLDDAQRTNFSIRDYVFASRCKDIGTNWPFPQQYLQLCLKHGVRDLLPPFEPPDLVRAQFNGKCVEIDCPVVCSQVEGSRTESDLDGINCTDLSDRVSDALKIDFTPPTHEPVLGSSQQPLKLLSEDKSTVVLAVSSKGELIHGGDELKVINSNLTRNIPSFVSEDPASLQETGSVSESSSVVEVAKPHLAEKIECSCEQSVKNCRLIVKFSHTIPEPSQTEDIVTNFSSVSDPMALKVCPVCKTFSSTSNTTLNAHIDQCLSVESTTKRVLIKLSQHKVKPRKKRSMEEIYATAPHCTLEDLDRRNGTNWAMDLTFVANNNETPCTIESKRPTISFPRASDAEREGAVYIDSNGKKLLILSKFNDAPPAAAIDCSGPKKIGKESRDKMMSPLDKKTCLSPKYKKYWKAKVQRNKRSSFNHLKGKIHKESKFYVDTQNEKEKISQSLKAQEQLKVDKPATLGQWICSKRSNLLKHLNSKLRHRKPRDSLAITHVTSMECCDQSASCDYYARGGRAKKCCKSPDELLSSSKTRSTNMLSNAVLSPGYRGENSASFLEKNARSMGKNSSTSNGIKLKLSKSRDDCVSSTKSKRVGNGIHANVVQKTGMFQNSTKTPVDCQPQVQKTNKGPRKSLLVDGPQYPIKTVKCNKVLPRIVSKKLRKHRFAEKAQKMVESIPLESAERCHDSHSAHDLGSASNNVASGMHQSNFLRNIDSIDHVLPFQSNILDSNQVDVNSYTSDAREYLALNHSQLRAECKSAEVIKFDVQTVLANIGSVSKCSMEKSVGPCGSEVATSEDHKVSTCDRLDSCVLLEHPREPSGENEAAIVAGISKLPGGQGMHSLVTASNVISQDVSQVDQMGSDVKDDYCSEPQNLEYQAHIASVQGFTACLTGFRDEVLEPTKSSSTHIQSNIVDGELSDSPASAASTLSNQSMGDLHSKGAEQELSEEAVISQGKLRQFSRNLGLPEDESVRGTGRTNSEKATVEVKAVTSAQEPENFWDVQPCCCSQGKSISHKPKISRRSMMAGRVLSTQTKQMTSSLCMRPASSFGGCSHSSSEAVAVPIFDSPTDSSSPRLSPDTALRFPTSSTFGSDSSLSQIQPQTTTSPILRLMGKNLMVMNREDMAVQQQSQALPCSPDDASNANYISLHAFYSTCNFSRQDDIQYHLHQSMDGSMISVHHPSNFQAPGPSHAERMGSFAGTLLQSELRLKADSHGHQKRLDKEPNSSGMYNLEKVSSCEWHEPILVTQASIPERGVMVIDDSPEHVAEPSGGLQNPASTMAPTFSGLDVQQVRPFCYPPQNLFQSRELGCGPKPAFSISCPRANTNSIMCGGISASLNPHLPRPFVFPSLSSDHLARALYYSPSFQ